MVSLSEIKPTKHYVKRYENGYSISFYWKHGKWHHVLNVYIKVENGNVVSVSKNMYCYKDAIRNGRETIIICPSAGFCDVEKCRRMDLFTKAAVLKVWRMSDEELLQLAKELEGEKD